MHSHDAIYLRFRMCKFSPHELQTIQGHGAGEQCDSASYVHDCKITAKMTPRNMNKRKRLGLRDL
jgi:hypothetical protein